VSWSAPDGRELFVGLDLVFPCERTGLVGRNGVGKTTLLKLIAGEQAPSAGHVAIEGSCGVMRQTVQVNPYETVADLFCVSPALAALRRAERGEASVDDLAELDWSLEESLRASLADMGLDVDTSTRLADLSGGQRGRAALAAATFNRPDFLLLDEPTNNLDRQGREAVLKLLRAWRGGAVVVSHDRELLEEMDAIVELTSLGARRYGGGWSAFREAKTIELAAAERDVARADRAAAEAKRAAQQQAERKARRDSAGARKGARGDMPRILAGARKNNAEATGASQARVAERQRAEADQEAAQARRRIEVLQPLNVTLPSTGLASAKLVLELTDVAAGFDAMRPLFRGLSFSLFGPERVAITGPNGSGKTTLLKIIAGELATISGRARVAVRFAMLDQRAGVLDMSASIRDNFLRMNPGATENGCRTALASFQFRADAALRKVAALSGGETLRAGLACVLGGAEPPALLLLDEPTNHLDLDSIAAVEAGLAAYDGALVVVSHDEAFLRAIGIGRRIALDRT
jgi:ATPase subunit of ABC transporter with duplicated ATPase domains